MTDLIERQAAIDGKISIQRTNGVEIYSDEAVPVEYLKSLPSAQPEQYWIDSEGNVSTLPSAQKTGNWTDKSIFYGEEGQIDMWQTCQCSECKRWDTRPYMYYFDEPNYCSFCGTKMGDEKE